MISGRKRVNLLRFIIVLALTLCTYITFSLTQRAHADTQDKSWLSRFHFQSKANHLPLYKNDTNFMKIKEREIIKNVTGPTHRLTNKKSLNQLTFANTSICSNIKIEELEPPNPNIHTFYYPWYGNVQNDGKYLHWNHEYIQHWNKQEAVKWPQGAHTPLDDVGASFYPQLGAYSSKDPAVVDCHMRMMRYAGIGELCNIFRLL